MEFLDSGTWCDKYYLSGNYTQGNISLPSLHYMLKLCKMNYKDINSTKEYRHWLWSTLLIYM